VYRFAKRLKDSNFSATVFPEDPGNRSISDLSRCGDGALGFENRNTHTRSGGAIAFIRDAVVNHGIRFLAFFGHSHGGGTAKLLATKIVALAQSDPAFASKGPRVIWTGYIDAVNVLLNFQGNDADGESNPVTVVPVLTKRHYNVYQEGFLDLHGGPMQQNPSNAHIDRDYQIDAGDVDAVTHSGSLGIDVNQQVQDELFNYFVEAAVNETTNP
jgi:hypothetical protein